ncbi:hypothetical protein PCANC_22609 [Puccinia coronata f. sp. avenae]|uniref:Uncharacterized protein n=1 Tax=Puccinia coronata f. sp. avenae TaxID=200324 RepID=A0A2N5S5L0_9BASI|nr:hypothetical protein PCANC_22609 [Puccinia coronata f. sp. avenae]
MWLPHFISALLCISHLTLYANATFLWFPYKVEGDLASDVMTSRPPASLPPRGSKAGTGRRTKGASSSSSPPPVTVDEALQYFSTRFVSSKTTMKQRQSMLVKSIAYLVHNDFAPEKLKEWTDALAKTSGPGAVGEEIAIVTHGFYTLLLKYPGEDIKNSVLRAKMTEWLDEAKFCLARPLLNAPNLSVWSRELFKPERGFSPQLQGWSTLNNLLIQFNEQNLRSLRMSISERDFSGVARNLEVIKEIFSSQPPTPLSSHTRVAALALLFHAMHIASPEVQTKAVDTATSLLGERRFFLFEHERTLLDKFTNDYVLDRPGKQIPI